MGLLKSPIWLKFYLCFPGFDLFKNVYNLAGYVTLKKIKPTLQDSNNQNINKQLTFYINYR